MKYQLDRPEGRGGRDYAAELNSEQYAAVTTGARHALVIAGAGSGKTRTLTYRVARLIETGVAPWRILLLTFTNKAAREMLERVAELSGKGASQVWGGTFHAVANRLLRRFAPRMGYREGFSILDTDDQKTLFRSLVKQFAGKMTKADRFPKPEVLLSLHSLAANTSRSWRKTLCEEFPYLERHEETIGKIYDEYARRKMEGNAMDFDDLLINLVRLLKEHEDVRGDLQSRFLHVLVDEYQDTNTLQEEIISLLSGGGHTSLMVVGDDAQSIYSWRGADVEHIFDFTHTYPDAEVHKIETNYRSLPAILDISNAVISQNEHRIAKEMHAARETPTGKPMLPAIIPAGDNMMEACFVAQRVDELLAGGYEPKDIAVLYRAHFHSLDVQMALTRRHIPYRITSGLRFFEQAHIKDVIAYLRLLSNPRDEMAFLRIAATFPKVGPATAAKLWAAWLRGVEAWFAAHPGCSAIAPPYAEMVGKVGVPAAAKMAWAEFLANMDELCPDGVELTPSQLVGKAARFMDAHIRTAYENYEERVEDFDQLVRSLSEQQNLDDFLSQVALMSEADQEVDAEDDRITLSTIHQAKGLEWKVVFIIFLGQGYFPHSRVINGADPNGLEEELRLFYVALTRAQDQLYLSYPRYNGRSYESSLVPPSSFLVNIPETCYEIWEV